MQTPTSPPIRKRFDYDSLDTADAVFVQQQTGAIQLLMKRSAQDIIEIGRRLIEVKKRLGHGRFGAWLKAEFEWTQETARRFMNVAQQFSQNPQIVEFAPSALYLLAEPSTPMPARSEAITRADAGEPITHKVAKEIKQKYSLSLRTKPEPHSEVESQRQLAEPELEILPPQLRTDAPQPRIIAPEPPTETIAAPTTTQPRQRATEPFHSKLEVMAIRPRESTALAIEETAEIAETAAATQKPAPTFVQPGSWWKLGEEHLLYCGDPASLRFRERLPDKVALSLAFPLSREEWPQASAIGTISTLALLTPYQQDQDFQLFREAIERFLMLYSNGGDSVVFALLPDPGILLLAHELECRSFCADPEPARCEAVIIAWQESGLRAEKVTGLRF